MISLFRSTIAAGSLAAMLSGAGAAPAAEEPRADDSSVAGAGERLAPTATAGGSRTIQLLLDLQANKPATFDDGATPARRDNAGAARSALPRAVLPPQFGLPGAPMVTPGARQSTATPPGMSPAQAAEWAGTGGAPRSDSTPRQGTGGSSSLDSDRPSARHLAWLGSVLGTLREHREAVLAACAVVIGVVWFGALASRQKHR